MVLRLAYEGDDMWMISSNFYPVSGMSNQVVYKRFRFSSGNQKMAAAQMADAVFQEMESRWRADRMTSFAEEQALYLRVPVGSVSEWLALEKEMKSWSFFDNVSLKGLYLPLVLVEVTYKGGDGDLSSRLLAEGWILNRDLNGNGATLVRAGIHE